MTTRCALRLSSDARQTQSEALEALMMTLAHFRRLRYPLLCPHACKTTCACPNSALELNRQNSAVTRGKEQQDQEE